MVAFIWGTAFVAQTTGMKSMGPVTFTGFRLLLGGVVLLPFTYFYFKYKSLNFEKIRILILMSFALLIGALFQQVALIYTNVANVAFLTALYALFYV